MNFEELLAKNKTAVIDKWFGVVVDSYPADTARFIKSQKDPFANPVGATTLKGLAGLMDELLGEMNHDTINSFLDPIIRIRAVQGFTPSQATSFVFSLKKIIRDSVINKKPDDRQIITELSHFEQKIDLIGLIAFDIYMKCREKIFQLKANEEKNRTYKVFERAGLIKEIPGGGQES
ncbi:MAG: RsbRD N-terminal domain-containing protein [Pseudomonadota bacterium]|nr:RsbRD N-terminal domain-containing protein [Pseudomonadota bacterium]MBU1399107.1 RsbRD N-terminal domain-containing protein [Pseudomonadota bacterium]MBU1570249.1 RsbRD N-terminal domain-containing protein [Pseudomonadota bacterium]